MAQSEEDFKTIYITKNFPNGKIIKKINHHDCYRNYIIYRNQRLIKGEDWFFTYEEALVRCEEIRQRFIVQLSSELNNLVNMKIE